MAKTETTANKKHFPFSKNDWKSPVKGYRMVLQYSGGREHTEQFWSQVFSIPTNTAANRKKRRTAMALADILMQTEIYVLRELRILLKE